MPGPPGAGRALGLPPVIAHRGASAHAPENTLAALRLAKELGAAWVEFDVKLTRDAVPILFHDDRLDRTTDGTGAVAAAAWREIRGLDAGAWFGPAYRGERVPTLGEALDLAGEIGLGSNVEIKPCAGRVAETARIVVETLASRVAPAGGTILISSFAHDALALARDIAPGLPRGYLAGHPPLRWASALERYGCTTMHLDHRWMRARRIAELRAAGVPLLLYTVNDAARTRRLLSWGATSVFSDRVGELLAAVDAA